MNFKSNALERRDEREMHCIAEGGKVNMMLQDASGREMCD